MSNLLFLHTTPLASHQWLLSEDVDLLPALLLPLAGPEQFGEDETEQLPLDLQFLPDDKQREPDPDLRKMLIEAIMKVCIIVPYKFYLPCISVLLSVFSPEITHERKLL